MQHSSDNLIRGILIERAELFLVTGNNLGIIRLQNIHSNFN